jgi:purine-nucleoside phosphorylase
VDAGATPGTVASTDLFYDPPLDSLGAVAQDGPLALDLQAAAILGVAARRAAEAAVVVGVTAQTGEPDVSDDLGVRLGEAGYAALRIP